MKTLVIHPKDKSTDFLKVIYETIENKTVITGGIYQHELHDLIKKHGRVIMLGHGTPYGLMSIGQFKNNQFHIIDYRTVHLLKEKENNIFIWCNANNFVEHFKLKGFYTGMFISEMAEAKYFRVNTNQELINESNNTFSKLVSDHVDNSCDVIWEQVKKSYYQLTKENNVAHYNHARLYLNT